MKLSEKQILNILQEFPTYKDLDQLYDAIMNRAGSYELAQEVTDYVKSKRHADPGWTWHNQKIESTYKVTVGRLKSIIKEALDDDINSIEVGDMVDVDTEWGGILPVRVVELVDDVRAKTGYIEKDPTAHPDEHTDQVFQGPGFVGDIDPESGESGQLVFSLEQVVPGSKAKYYFPHLGTELDSGAYADWDEYGRDVQNPYRKMAQRQVIKNREPWHSYAAGLSDNMEEAASCTSKSYIHEGYEKDGAFWGFGEEIQQMIAAMPIDEPADLDYIDEETGEILLGKGDLPRDSRYHPAYAIDMELKKKRKNAEREAEEAAWAAEDRAEDREREEAKERERAEAEGAYRSAIAEFALGMSSYAGDMGDDAMTPDQVAPDAALGFFFQYPEWKQWARLLDLTKADIKSAVADEIYQAMLS